MVTCNLFGRKYLVGILSFTLICSMLLMSNTIQLEETAQSYPESTVLEITDIDWWDDSWLYGQKISFVNTGVALASYQFLIELQPANFQYDLADSNGDDIRFIDSDNITMLNYWIEDWNYEGTSNIWVNIPTIGASTTHSIMMYYGNIAASSLSNGTKVFEVFDDFSGTELNQNLWDVTEYSDGTSNYEVTNGELHTNMSVVGYGNHAGYYFKLKQNSTYENFVITLKSRWANLDYYRGFGIFNGLSLVDNDSQASHNAICLWGDSQVAYHQYSDGTGVTPNAPDYSVGSSLFEYSVLNDSFEFGISGTLNSDLIFTGPGFSRPFSTCIYSNLGGRDESSVYTDVYFDYFYIRNNTEAEPIVSIDLKIYRGPNITNWNKEFWTYCQSIEISNIGIALNDYQIEINLASSNFEYSLANSEGDDIRFTQTDNITLLNYWIEEWNYEGSSKLWVKIPSIAASSNQTIFMHYGNPYAKSSSNGTLVFEAFDDFSGTVLSDNLWTVAEYSEAGYRFMELVDGELHTNISTSGLDNKSGYLFQLKENLTIGNFAVTLKSRWANCDSDKGEGIFNGLLLRDDDLDYTYKVIELDGDLGQTCYTNVEGTTSIFDITDYSSGSSYAQYKILGTLFNLKVNSHFISAGTWSNPNFHRPFNVLISSMFNGSDGSNVSADVYFDFIYVKKAASDEPTISINTLEGVIIDFTPPTINLGFPVEYGFYAPNTIIAFTITDTNGLAEVLYNWDSDSNSTAFIQEYGVFHALLPDSPGGHMIEIFAEDLHGNSAYDYFVFNTEQIATAPAPTPTSNSTPSPSSPPTPLISQTTPNISYVVAIPLVITAVVSISFTVVVYKIIKKRKQFD